LVIILYLQVGKKTTRTRKKPPGGLPSGLKLVWVFAYDQKTKRRWPSEIRTHESRSMFML